MILSRYGFGGLLVEKAFEKQKTSDLLYHGLAATMIYPGIAIYSPIGEHILSQIEASLEKRFVAAGFEFIRLPSLVQTSDLGLGEAVGEQFRSKLMHLSGEMRDYHLLSTPEVLFLRLFGHATLSQDNLPVRLSYCADFHRDMPKPKKLLVARQFRIFGAISLEINQLAAVAAVADFRQLLLEEMASRRLPLECVSDSGGNSKFEAFYPSSEGDSRLEGPAGNATRAPERSARRALSLGIAYHYAHNVPIPTRYRTRENRNGRPSLASFGVCTNRLLYALCDQARDSLGFNLPESLRPFEVSIVPQGEQELAAAHRLFRRLRDGSLRVALDDRLHKTQEKRKAFAEYLGTPVVVHVGREGFSLRLRGQTGQSSAVPEGAVLAAIHASLDLVSKRPEQGS